MSEVENPSVTECRSKKQLFFGDSFESEPTRIDNLDGDGGQKPKKFNLADFSADAINNPAVRSRLKPFHPTWTYGFNPRAAVINIAGDDRTQIFFTSSHLGVLYDYKTGEMKFLEGHQGEIISVAADGNLKYLLTADGAPSGENCLIIWDLKECVPLLTFFNIYPKSGTLLSRMNRKANYILTMGYDGENYLLDYWIWSHGHERPESTYKFSSSYGAPKKICINPADENRLMIILERQVFFITIDPVKNELVEMAVPETPPSLFHKTGYFTHGALVKNSHKQFASTSKGYIYIFANSLVHREDFDITETDKGKFFINALKITNETITCMRQTAGMLMVGTTRGKIYFFDNRVRILYWLTTPDRGDIRSISFDFVPRKYRPIKVRRKPTRARYFTTFPGERSHHRSETDRVRLFKREEAPIKTEGNAQVVNQFNTLTASTLDRQPFIIKNFLVATSNCNIFKYDYISNKFSLLFEEFHGDVSAIEANYKLPHIVLGFRSGRITLIHHESNKIITTAALPKCPEEDKGFISSIKFSPNCFHLVCGRANGELWILETILLIPKTPKPLKCGDSKIKKIRFSSDSTQFAYIDDDHYIYLFLLNRDTGKWIHKGRIRSHYKETRDILFYPDPKNSILCTIGADRYITEYNNLQNMDTEDFQIKTRERILQSSMPNCFTTFTKNVNGKPAEYFLIADDQNKLLSASIENKIIRSVVLGPAYGCFKKQTLLKMTILDNDPRIMIFMTKRHMGLQILPADGSPFKYVGYLVHPARLHNFVISADGKYVFTLGMFDKSVLKWEIKTKSVKVLERMGGKELDAFYCLLDGGRNGWIFQEMVDLFYYMQILEQGENYALPRKVNDTISIEELPDLVRACGFFPTEYELENMMIDIKYRDYDDNQTVRKEINFSEFVKLFINHRPAYGYDIKDIKSSFKTMVKSSTTPRGNSIHKSDFIELLTSAGEPITTYHLKKCFHTLLKIQDDDTHSSWLPSKIFFETLAVDILGIVQETSYSEEQLNLAMLEDSAKEEQEEAAAKKV